MLPEETRVGLRNAGALAPVDGTIYILLPVHDRRAVTETFVRSLLDQSDQGFHLVLIDDGSTDGTADGVTALLPSTTVLRGRGSWWWAGSLQQGQRWLATRPLGARDLVLLINDDTRIEPTFLARARTALADSHRTLLMARMFDLDSGEYLELGVRVNWRRLTFKAVLDDPARVNCLSTRGLFLNAADFVELGGFHPRLLPHYLSDYAFTIRAFRQGFSLVTDPGIRLWNDPTTTGIKGPKRTAGAFLRSTLTRRSPSNPIYMSTFVLITSPRRRVAGNLVIVWRRYVRAFRRARSGGGS